MRRFPISIALLLCGAIAAPLVAAANRAPAAKAQPAAKATEDNRQRDCHERNQGRHRESGAKPDKVAHRHGSIVKPEREDDHDE